VTPSVVSVLNDFADELRGILGDNFRGMYLTGSLALGDFDPNSSDIDFVVLTEVALSEDVVEALRDMHARFHAGDSPWARKIEAIYVTPEALRPSPMSTGLYPQVEKDRSLFLAPLESEWMFHLYTLREHGVTIVGMSEAGDVRRMIEPIDPDDMRGAAAPIAEYWLGQALHDPTWLIWLRELRHQAFVVLTLCRLLYTLETGAVASKPAAAGWAEHALGPRWAPLVARSLVGQHGTGEAPERDVEDTIALLRYTVERFRRWKGGPPPAR
jgi:hypothetical protein